LSEERHFSHADLPDAGSTPHHIIDDNLPNDTEKAILTTLREQAPVSVSGARNNPEAALADLLAALEVLGLITDNTTAT
jgi:hypothetical protein